MKQKIVMEVQMNCAKCRTKALEIAAETYGVEFVGLAGDKDKVEVIGDGIDSIKLAKTLRKKVGHTNIVTVSEVKPK